MAIVPSSRPRSTLRERMLWKSTYEGTPYDALPWFSPHPSYPVELALRERFLPSQGSVVDIGCGAGSNVLFLASQGLDAHGVDLAPGAVKVARKRALEVGLRISVQEGDAVCLPFPDGSMDAAVDNGCFHALRFELRRPYAREVYRILRPDGRFVLSWIGRETQTPEGPPHRPSLEEIASVFEERFLFVRTSVIQEGDFPPWTSYFAWLARRTSPRPPRR